eukprot:5448728-Prymnesium_polylepis.1
MTSGVVLRAWSEDRTAAVTGVATGRSRGTCRDGRARREWCAAARVARREREGRTVRRDGRGREARLRRVSTTPTPDRLVAGRDGVRARARGGV